MRIPAPPFLPKLPLICYINLLAAIYLVVVILQEPPNWSTVALAGCAGFNVAAAFFEYMASYANARFDTMVDLCDKLHQINKELLNELNELNELKNDSI